MAEQLAGVTAGACLSSVSSGAATPGPSQLRSLWSSPPQVSIRLDGENKAVEYNAVGAVKDAVRVVFRGPRVSDLFDREWHKIALSIQAQNVTLYVDCVLVHTLPIEERENIDIQGKTVIGKRLYDSVPIDVSTGGLHSVLHTCLYPTSSSPWTVSEGRVPTQDCRVGTQSHHRPLVCSFVIRSVIRPFEDLLCAGTVLGAGDMVHLSVCLYLCLFKL